MTKYTYDANGNKTKVTNARGKETRYEYNEVDEVTKVTDPLNKSTHYDYDLNGNQTKITYPNGNRVEYGYNAVDRNTSISHNGTKRYSFEYDPNGNVTKETDHSGNEVTAYTYDADNKVKTVSRGSSNKTDYTYDKNGNIIEQAYTAGNEVFRHTFTYNALDQLIRITEDGKNRAWFTYDEGDRIASRKNGDGTVTLFRYNGAGDLVEQIILDKQGELLDKFTYTYDNKGNITAIKSSAGTTQYVYDSLDQLIKETRPDGTVYEYTYDATGNRLTQKVTKGSDIKTTTYTYDDADQLTAVNGKNQTYDDNGNLTNDGERTYVYDAENRLTEVKDKDGNTIVSFTYRADGMRKTMTTGSKTTTFHYDENKNVTHETDGNNQVIASYTYADNQPISMTRGGKTYYYQTNYRGDVVALTDSAGAVVATYEYDAYGNLLKETGTVENPYRYAGYRYDKETGLYYLQSRYYNPETGRFLTRDAIEGDEDNPLSFNKYAYAENNPTGKIDPDGNRAFWFGSISRSGSSVRIYIKKWIVTTWQNLSIGFYHFATYVIAILASPSVVVGGLIAVVGNLFIRAFDQITSSRIGRKGTRIIIRGKYYSNRVNKLIRKRIYKRTRWGVKRYSVRVRIRKTVRTWYPTGFSVTKWN